MNDNLIDGPGLAARRLRRLRERANVGYREMARLAGIDFSQYRHYEERYKKDSLPVAVYNAVRPILTSRGITEGEAQILLNLEGLRADVMDQGEKIERLELQISELLTIMRRQSIN